MMDTRIATAEGTFVWTAYLDEHRFCSVCGAALMESVEPAGFSTSTGRPLVRTALRCPVGLGTDENPRRRHPVIVTEGIEVAPAQRSA